MVDVDPLSFMCSDVIIFLSQPPTRSRSHQNLWWQLGAVMQSSAAPFLLWPNLGFHQDCWSHGSGSKTPGWFTVSTTVRTSWVGRAPISRIGPDSMCPNCGQGTPPWESQMSERRMPDGTFAQLVMAGGLIEPKWRWSMQVSRGAVLARKCFICPNFETRRPT